MSIPSNKWFPASLQERAAWYINFNTNIAVVGASLGLTAGELTSIDTDTDIMQFLAVSAVQVEAFTDALRNYRKTVTEADIGDPTPAIPADIVLGAPAGVPTGIFERLDNFVKRIRVAPAYTPETGALLGIIPAGAGGPSLPVGDLPPSITASVDPGNVIEVKFKKGDSDGIYIEANVDNAGFEFKEKALRSPAVFSVPASPTGVPRGVQIRARFLDGNSPVGDWSDIVVVQTIP